MSAALTAREPTLNAPSVRICGRMYTTGKTSSQFPANHYDMPGSKKASNDTYEQVCYFDDRTGPSSMLQYVQCGDLYGSSYEIVDDNARGASSISSVTSGYFDMCSKANIIPALALAHCLKQILVSKWQESSNAMSIVLLFVFPIVVQSMKLILINKEPNGFQTSRSRLYLDSIFSCVYNRHCLISPVSEGLSQMVEKPEG